MITVSHVQKQYVKHRVLVDISFEAKCGECLVIVGKNGCGKSTLLQIMAGIQKADGGSIQYYGENAKALKTIRKYIGYVPQENPLIEELTVKDNLHLWDVRKNSQRELLVKQFGLEEIQKQTVRQLSGGMKRRLSIACALLGLPSILLLDEPTSALDLYYKNSIQNWIKRYLQGNGTVIMTSHDESEIMQADRCLWLENGVIQDIGNVSNMEMIRTKMLNEEGKKDGNEF